MIGMIQIQKSKNRLLLGII